MSTSRTILRAGGVAALAAAGYVAWQQHGPVRASAPADMPVVADSASGVALRAPPPPPTPVDAPTGPAEALSPFGLPCGLSVHGDAMPGAIVALDIMAPCRPGMPVEIEHAGLTVSAVTDAAGLLTIDFPALETPAFFTLRLADGEEAVTLAGLPDLVDIGRVAVSWQGDLGIALHAFEGGAGFGTPGHVCQEAPGSAADATIGTGGFLSRLGESATDQPRMAQVYSYPRATLGAPRLAVDIPVTEATCGRPVQAESHQTTAEGRILSQPITLVLPGCDAVGGYLVLQNLFDGLRLASN